MSPCEVKLPVELIFITSFCTTSLTTSASFKNSHEVEKYIVTITFVLCQFSEPSPSPAPALVAAAAAAMVIEETSSVPPPPLAPPVIATHQAASWKKQSSDTRSTPASSATNEANMPSGADLLKATGSLKPVGRPNGSVQQVTEEQPGNNPQTRSGVSSMRAMFEQRNSSQQAPAKRPPWRRTNTSNARNNTQEKPPTANGEIKVNKPAAWVGSKPFTIVETSSVFQWTTCIDLFELV